MAKSEGKKFEEDFKKSCPEEGTIERIKDAAVFINCPYKEKNPQCQQKKVSSNPCDYILFYSPVLFYLELKSGSTKSFSFDEKIIKAKQIEGLEKRVKPFVFPGFIFNFRNYNNETWFVHILRFLEYKNKTDRKSIPLEICQQIGVNVSNELKKVRYRYDVKKLIQDIIGQSIPDISIN